MLKLVPLRTPSSFSVARRRCAKKADSANKVVQTPRPCPLLEAGCSALQPVSQMNTSILAWMGLLLTTVILRLSAILACAPQSAAYVQEGRQIRQNTHNKRRCAKVNLQEGGELDPELIRSEPKDHRPGRNEQTLDEPRRTTWINRNTSTPYCKAAYQLALLPNTRQ